MILSGLPEQAFNVSWDASEDVEGDAVTYTWTLADAAERILLHLDAGSLAEATSTFGSVAAAMTASGIGEGSTAELRHWVTAHDAQDSTRSAVASVSILRGAITSTESAGELPEQVTLNANYPNPFNPVTTLRFGLPVAGRARLAVYDVLGQQVAVLVNKSLPAGWHEVQWDAGHLRSGTYLQVLEVDGQRRARVLSLVK